MPQPALILASGSAARARILAAAGLIFEVVRPALDEESAKRDLRAAGADVRTQAMALAEQKACSVSRAHAGLVIGADQMLSQGGAPFDKPTGREDARRQLQALRGASHELATAIVLARDGEIIWRALDAPVLTMRAYTDDFIETYLDRVGAAAFASVGAYQLEGWGVHLFERVEGDFFSILGLPLLPLLGALRAHGAAPA